MKDDDPNHLTARSESGRTAAEIHWFGAVSGDGAGLPGGRRGRWLYGPRRRWPASGALRIGWIISCWIGLCNPAVADQPPAFSTAPWLRLRTGAPLDAGSVRVNRRPRIRPLPPEQDARVTAPSPWMIASPPMTQAVWASRTAFSGRFASTAGEDQALSPEATIALRFGPTTPKQLGAVTVHQ